MLLFMCFCWISSAIFIELNFYLFFQKYYSLFLRLNRIEATRQTLTIVLLLHSVSFCLGVKTNKFIHPPPPTHQVRKTTATLPRNIIVIGMVANRNGQAQARGSRIEFMVDIAGSAIFLVHKLYPGSDLRGNSNSEKKLQIISNFFFFAALTRKLFLSYSHSLFFPSCHGMNLVETKRIIWFAICNHRTNKKETRNKYCNE